MIKRLLMGTRVIFATLTAAASPNNATKASSCVLRPYTRVAVFVDTAAGTGTFSAQWENKFWSWWAANSTAAPSHQFVDLSELDACSSSELLAAGTLVIPGGNAYLYTQHLGFASKLKILDFLRGGGLYVGTCAGWYYASRGYYWEYDTQWPDRGLWQYPSLLGAFDALTEGSITDIADEESSSGVFDGHALTRLVSGHHAIYYGGPTLGWHHTAEASKPAGTVVLERFAALPGAPAAAVRLRSPHDRLLLFSVHLEAFEGIGVSTLSTAQREANYALRAQRIAAEMNISR